MGHRDEDSPKGNQADKEEYACHRAIDHPLGLLALQYARDTSISIDLREQANADYYNKQRKTEEKEDNIVEREVGKETTRQIQYHIDNNQYAGPARHEPAIRKEKGKEQEG